MTCREFPNSVCEEGMPALQIGNGLPRSTKNRMHEGRCARERGADAKAQGSLRPNQDSHAGLGWLRPGRFRDRRTREISPKPGHDFVAIRPDCRQLSFIK